MHTVMCRAVALSATRLDPRPISPSRILRHFGISRVGACFLLPDDAVGHGDRPVQFEMPCCNSNSSHRILPQYRKPSSPFLSFAPAVSSTITTATAPPHFTPSPGHSFPILCLPSPFFHITTPSYAPQSAFPATSFTSSNVLPIFTTLNRNNRGSKPSVRCTICCVCALESKRMMK